MYTKQWCLPANHMSCKFSFQPFLGLQGSWGHQQPQQERQNPSHLSVASLKWDGYPTICRIVSPFFSPVFLVTGNQTLQLEIRHGNGCKNHGGFSNWGNVKNTQRPNEGVLTGVALNHPKSSIVNRMFHYPLVNSHITMENHHFLWENPL